MDISTLTTQDTGESAPTMPQAVPGRLRTVSPLTGYFLSALLLTAITLLTFWPQAFDGAAFPWDFAGKYTTAPAFVSASIENGAIPRWAPGTASGTPILEDPGTGVYYPLWWLTALLQTDLTLNMFAKIQVLHVIAGGLGVTALARSRRIGWVWAVVAASGFVLNGAFVGQAQHANFVRGFAMLPWMMWAATPPEEGRRWTRLLALPPLAYLLAAGGYPGQMASFPIVLAVYVAVEWWHHRERFDRLRRVALGFTTLACALSFAAVYAGFFASADSITRVNPGSAAQRALIAFDPADLLGLFLNPFLFHTDGTTFSWALATPLLLGLLALSRVTLRRHAALAASGGAALVLAVLPAWKPAGQLMMWTGPLFTSRFPAADYKIAVTCSLAVLGAVGWQRLLCQPEPPWWRVAIGAGLIAGGMWLGSAVGGPEATRFEFVIVGILGAAVALAAFGRRLVPLVALALLLLLVVGDGLRSRADTVADFGGVSVRPYEFYANPDQLTARDGAAGQLPSALRHPPDSRPARTPPFRSPRLRTQGTPIDALGFLAMGYRIQGHGGFQTAAKVEALRDPMLTEMLLEPWTAWTVPCTEIDCDRIEQLPDPAAWRTTDAARTLSYGTDTIDYEINLAERALLIENEINFPGWGTDSDLVRAVDHDGPFRAWVAESGSYQFRAQFRTTTLRNAVLLATAALVAWSVAAAMVFWHRSRPQAAADPPTGDSTGSVLEDRAPTAGEEGVNGSSDGSAAAPATFGS